MYSNDEQITDLESQLFKTEMRAEYYAHTGNDDAYNYAMRDARAIEERISDLRNLGRDDSEPDVTDDADDFGQVIADDTATDPMISGPWGTRNERITRLAHAKRLNVWRARQGNYAGKLMVGRVVIGFNVNGLPAAKCTHCGWAASPASNHRDAQESFTILLIAHGHNDGPTFARRYRISEQSCYYRTGITLAEIKRRNWLRAWATA